MTTNTKNHFMQWYADNLITSLTLFGTPLFYLFVVVVLSQFDHVATIHLIALLATVELVCWAIKFFYKKERPKTQERRTFIENLDANSFPSIHTARISALATFFCIIYNNTCLNLLGLVLILGVGWSRIALKKHYLNDVIGGLLVGTALAVVWSLFML